MEIALDHQLLVGFMTGPRPMTLHFILVASVSCWEVLFCCWQPYPPGKHATSNSPSQPQQPFCTKLPQMFRGILEGSIGLLFRSKVSLWLTLNEFKNKNKNISYSLSPVFLFSLPKTWDYSVCYYSWVLDIVKILARLKRLSLCKEIIYLQTPLVPLQGTRRGLLCFKTASSMTRYMWRPVGTKPLSSLCLASK